MNYKYKISILFFLATVNFINSQSKYNFDQFLDDGGKIFERPIKWNGKDWAALGIFSLATFSIMNYDDDIKHYIQKERNGSDNLIMQFGTLYGEPYVPLATALGFYLHGAAADNKHNKNVAFELTEAFVYTGIVTTIVKFAFGRERPFQAKSSSEFYPFSFKNNAYMSFFSGHTSSAFSMSTILAENTDSDLLKIAAFIPAFITGASRVYHDRHWTSDVFMGAIAGYFIGKFVHDLHEEEAKLENVQPTSPLINFIIPL